MRRHRQSDNPKYEQERAEEQKLQFPNVSVQSRPSTNALAVMNGQNQGRPQNTSEARQIPPVWLLPALLISFMGIAVTAAILSFLIKDIRIMLVDLAMTFVLVYSAVRYYFPSTEGLVPKLFTLILKLFNRQI